MGQVDACPLVYVTVGRELMMSAGFDFLAAMGGVEDVLFWGLGCQVGK